MAGVGKEEVDAKIPHSKNYIGDDLAVGKVPKSSRQN
jgi:hypothetical protein